MDPKVGVEVIVCGKFQLMIDKLGIRLDKF